VLQGASAPVAWLPAVLITLNVLTVWFWTFPNEATCTCLGKTEFPALVVVALEAKL
jgi:hypothetical protein